jgi:hypothetical protein
MIKRGLYLIVLAVLAVTQASAMSEQDKIRALLSRIETSGLIFIRNGSEYSSGDARKHLELKLSKAGSLITTADQFITHIASGSFWSGEPYYIKLPDGSKMKSAEWLRKALVEIEKNNRR